MPVVPELVPLFTANILLATPLEVGEGPLGRRRVIPIIGGDFAGERMRGRIIPGGADWQVVAADGTAYLEARYTLEADDGALISVHNHGIRHGPPEVLAAIYAGEQVPRDAYYMRAVPRFETGAEAYRWLCRTVCLATGGRKADAVELDVFEVR